MASSANNNALYEPYSIERTNINVPDIREIAAVLDEALKRNYAEASVQWDTSPNLSLPPFNLAAEGICGSTALLEFGDMSYFNLPVKSRKLYNFRHILRRIDRYNIDSFIFGHGIYRHPYSHTYRELVLNTSFLPTSNEEIESRNKSRLTFINAKCNSHCDARMLTQSSDVEGTVQGTYFLCDGSRTNAPVLKVYAKGPYLDNTPFCGSKRFINSMQNALEKKYGSKHFVALGGVYAVNGVFWLHELTRNDWESASTSLTDANSICHVNMPETMITIFNSSTEPQLNSKLPIKLNSSQSIHSLLHHSASVHFPLRLENNNTNTEEYIGYFCPAKTLYRIDAPLQ